MARNPKPWWRKDRRCWFVTIDGVRHNLGPNREFAFQRFHELMAAPKRKMVASDSVLAIIDAFLEWTKRHRASRTYEWYLQRCQWFVQTIPALTVAQLKPFHVQQWLKEKIGKKICLYTFRHSFATRMLEAGTDALTVAILLGHADVSMLGSVYQHLSHNPKHLLEQIRKAAG